MLNYICTKHVNLLNFKKIKLSKLLLVTNQIKEEIAHSKLQRKIEIDFDAKSRSNQNKKELSQK